MKEIGILTFHSANNYGAFLQAKSLQDILNMYDGCKVEIINYRPRYITQEYSLMPDNAKNVKQIILQILRARDIIKRNRKFELYRKQNFLETQEVSSVRELKKLCNRFDIVVVGSDQVWNFDITGSDFGLFFDGVNEKIRKYAYAASTGGYEYSMEEKNRVKELLGGFIGVSVREKSTLDYLTKELGMGNVKTVLDPVFLTERKRWLDFAKKPFEKDYILFFQMGTSPKAEPALKLAQEMSKKSGYKLLYFSDQERWYKFRDIKHIGIASPSEFLGYIANAKCVITNSFHATAFSIIFNTPFFVETKIARSNRIIDLITLLGLEKQSLNQGKINCDFQTINWDNTNKLLNIERKKSMEYTKFIVDN